MDSSIMPAKYIFNGAAKEKLIQTFVVILKGRHRYCKSRFMWDREKQCTFGAPQENGLRELLRRRFGFDAEGLLIHGEIWRTEEEIMRRGVFESGQSYFVVYNNTMPTCLEAKVQPPAYDLPEGVCKDREVHRVQGYTYYTGIPTLTKELELDFGKSKKRLVMSNKDTEHFDQLVNFLSTHAPDRWAGVLVDGQEYADDSILYDKSLVPGKVYPVTYKLPGKLNVLQKISDRTNNVRYSSIAD